MKKIEDKFREGGTIVKPEKDKRKPADQPAGKE